MYKYCLLEDVHHREKMWTNKYDSQVLNIVPCRYEYIHIFKQTRIYVYI